MEDLTGIGKRFERLKPVLDERTRRLLASAEAMSVGHGGVSLVSRVTGVSRPAIGRGIAELKAPEPPEPSQQGRIRRPGGGRKRRDTEDATLIQDLENLVGPTTRGDPESPLRWTGKSVRALAAALQEQGHRVSHTLVAALLHELGYSLQGNKKTLEGASHPDRDAQFMHINEQVQGFQEEGQPAISVDTKKKELVGDFKNGGRTWRPKGQPEEVRVHDFVIPELGRAAPYGVYDIVQNVGWVSVGVDHDTAAFAVESIRRWWQTMGKPLYKDAKRLLITADGGGSNGSRVRLWKVELQRFADETGLEVSVCHLPPGTSKWNKIEHKMFSFITMNWRGKPLVSHEVIVQLIAATKTKMGLRVQCALDTTQYPAGIKVADADMAKLNLRRSDFHGEWNYTIAPAAPDA